MPILLYGSKAMIWREKERSRIRVVQMDNLRGLLVIRRMDRVPIVRIGELCGVAKEVDESVLHCFGNIERVEDDRNAKMSVYGRVGDWPLSRSSAEEVDLLYE